ncbi:MAG TPA: carboxymuconolactone decarboxylase family protein [Azospirillum sp.]|nr:carboxymuconolactone decarboxylase family protein [Azospirillum sp.]
MPPTCSAVLIERIVTGAPWFLPPGFLCRLTPAAAAYQYWRDLCDVTLCRSSPSNGQEARIGRAFPWMEMMMSLTMLEKELVAVAVSVAAGCRPCTTHHLAEVKRAGATGAAIEKAVAGAVCVRTSATEGMRRHALGLEPAQDGCGCGATDALAELIAISASLAINCTANLDKHLAAAQALGVPREHIDEVAALAAMIRSKAVHHVEKRLGDTAVPGPAAGCTPVAAPAGCC